MTELRTGAGSSELADPTAAGRAAATAAVGELGGATPALVLVYASMRYDLAELLAGIRSVTGDAPLVGSTSSGQFLDGEMIAPGAGVCVLVLSAGPYRFGVASGGGLGTDPYATGRDLVRDALADLGPDRPRHGAVLLLADGFGGDLQNLLNGVYRVAGANVPVIGGAASTDRDMTKKTFVFHDTAVLTDSAVAVWIGAERPLRVVSGHGWQAHGLPLLVTRVDGVVVHEIAGRPALDVYQEKFRDDETPGNAGLDPWLGFHATRAFGLIEPDGTEILRGVYVSDDNLPRTFTPLPAYSAVRIMTATADDLLNVSEGVVADALAVEGAAPRVLITFSCAARMEILQDRRGEEAVRLQKAAGPVRTFGFYTYGEFARTTGVSGYHNATVAALAL